MIAWNAFLEYFVNAGENPKFIVLVIVAAGLIMRWLKVNHRIYFFLENQSSKSVLWLILGIGFILRLLWILWSPHMPPSAGTEDKIILRHAHELASGQGYLTADGHYSADRPIGYALVLALLFRCFGENPYSRELLHLAFSVLTIYLIYHLGSQLGHKIIGWFGALLLALYPTAIFASKITLEEHLFIPLWLLGITLLIDDLKNPSWKKVIAAGLILGIAAHFRTHAFAMGMVAFAAWFWVRRDLSQAFLRALVLQLLILSFAIPWGIRNYIRFQEPILYTTWIGPALYYSNNDTADIRYPVNSVDQKNSDPEFLNAKNEVEKNRLGKKAALKWIQHHPDLFIQKSIGKVIYMLGLTREDWVVKDNFYTLQPGRQLPPKKLLRWFDRIDTDYYGVIFLLAILGAIGIVFCKHSLLWRDAYFYIFFTLGYYLLIVALTMGHRKYRFTIEPFFCLLAGAAFFIIYFGNSPKISKIQ